MDVAKGRDDVFLMHNFGLLLYPLPDIDNTEPCWLCSMSLFSSRNVIIANTMIASSGMHAACIVALYFILLPVLPFGQKATV